jgi:hypothetical protein
VSPARSVQTTTAPPGLAREVLAAAGCSPDGATWALLEVVYDERGHVGGLSMPPMPPLSPECLKASRALLLGGIVPGPSPPARGDSLVLLLPLSSDFVACSAEGPSASRTAHPPERAGRRIEAPRKIHNVRPEYPRQQATERIQGSSLLEAEMPPRGASARCGR